MKILAAGDIHGDSLVARKLAEKAEKEKVDLVILTGDITFHDRPFSNIIKPFTEKKKKILIIPGNHDSFATTDVIAEIYGIKNIHGYSVRHGDVGIFGCSGVNVGQDALTEKDIFNIFEKAFEGIKDLEKKIMVTHVPPSQTLSEKLSTVVSGSLGVKKAIQAFKPDLVLCSHIHEAEGVEQKIGKTKIINVGREGKIIEV